MALYSYEIGATLSTTSLEALATPVTYPRSSYLGFSRYIDLGDGTRKGVGWKMARWHWDVISRAERDMLRTFCTGASAEVYINTRKNDTSDVYDKFSCVMIWPEEEEKDANRRRDFTIEFRNLVEV